MSDLTPKTTIQEAIAKLDDAGLIFMTGIACLLLCQEAGKLEAAVTALEQIADGEA